MFKNGSLIPEQTIDRPRQIQNKILPKFKAMTDAIQAFEIIVRGRVQGVGFRYSVQQQARGLGLKGWVQNLPDGSVKLRIRGSSSSCHSLISWCRNNPGYSWVENMDIRENPQEEWGAFRIRH